MAIPYESVFQAERNDRQCQLLTVALLAINMALGPVTERNGANTWCKGAISIVH